MKKLLKEHGTAVDISKQAVIEALQIVLDNNTCSYTDNTNKTTFARPIKGTAMGPSHACDYVDCFMSELDKKTCGKMPSTSYYITASERNKRRK